MASRGMVGGLPVNGVGYIGDGAVKLLNKLVGGFAGASAQQAHGS